MILLILRLVGSLGLFLYGMRVMSDGIQKVAGNKFQSIMNYMTNNRVLAVLTGFLITSLVQSSSATTVMVVSFVNASLLSLSQAIGVIMGANIGTTVTTWLVSFLGFGKVSISAYALPVIGIGFPLLFSKIRKRRDLGEVLIGFGLLFLGLMFMRDSVPNLENHPEILSFLQHYTGLGFGSFIIFIFVGALLTIAVQSSSAALAITVTMAFKGWIDFPTAAAIVLGENIGTTITAYLASLGTNVNARRAARAHLLFNLLGIIWMAFVFHYFIQIVYSLTPWDHTAQGNLPLTLSLFHTVFNITNTIVFLPFLPLFAKAVEYLVKPTEKDKLKEYSFKYISLGVQDTAQLNIVSAKKEIAKMAGITKSMFQKVINVFFNPNKKMGYEVDKVKALEELTDDMQKEISKYLVDLSQEKLTERSYKTVNAMMRIVHELEAIADSCFKLILLLQRKYENEIQLHPKAHEEITNYADLVFEFIDFYKKHITEHLQEEDLDIAYRLEAKINESRDSLKHAAQIRLQEGANVDSELLYIDLLKNFEHIGDNALNVAQALRNVY